VPAPRRAAPQQLTRRARLQICHAPLWGLSITDWSLLSMAAYFSPKQVRGRTPGPRAPAAGEEISIQSTPLDFTLIRFDSIRFDSIYSWRPRAQIQSFLDRVFPRGYGPRPRAQPPPESAAIEREFPGGPFWTEIQARSANSTCAVQST